MASTYSTNLKLELIGTGDQSGTWGTTTNTNLGSLIEEAIAGYVTQAVTDGAATVLTIPDGVSSNGRNYVIELTGVLTANRTVEVPAVDKPYIFFNNTSGGYSVTVKVSGQTGVTIANGKKAIVYTNSTDVIEVANAPVTEAGTQTLTNKTLSSPTITGSLGLTSATSIVVNSSSDALRITQTGAGNALLVEDEANPDSTPFVITSDGTVIIGDTTTGATLYDVQSLTTDGASYLAQIYAAGSGGAFIRMDKSRSATIGTNTVVNNGDTIGTLEYRGADGTNFIAAAQIQAEVDGTPGTNDMPGRLVFSTTADGASTTTERMRIDSAGNVGIGATATAKLDVFSISNNIVLSRSSGGYAAFQRSAPTGQQVYDLYSVNNVEVARITADGGNFMAFSTGSSATERMRIDSSGNVGIGNTPSGTYKLQVTGSAYASTTVNDGIGEVRTVPVNSQTGAYVAVSSDAGKFISITTGGVTVNASTGFTTGQSVSIYNNSGSNQTITATGITLYQVGTANTGNRTLAQRGLCTILCVGSNTYVITGGGVT